MAHALSAIEKNREVGFWHALFFISFVRNHMGKTLFRRAQTALYKEHMNFVPKIVFQAQMINFRVMCGLSTR